MNHNKKRSKALKRALGGTGDWIWKDGDHDAFSELHPPADPLALSKDDDDHPEQSFLQFMNMARREPNERGTGRWNVTPQQRTIAIVALDSRVSRPQLESLKGYLQAFFLDIDIEIHESTILEINGPKKSLLMKHSSETSATKQRKHTRFPLDVHTIDGEPHVEVFSLLNAMSSTSTSTSSKQPPPPQVLLDHYYCVLGVTSHNLAEVWEDDDNGTWEVSPVLGRACGDRVCVVQTPGSETELLSFWATCTHELLHCFGMDHCTTFRCLMNSVSVQDEECLFLSPLNLKKWVVGVLGLPKDSLQAQDYVVARYQALFKALEILPSCLRAQRRELQDWLRQKIQLVSASNKNVQDTKRRRLKK